MRGDCVVMGTNLFILLAAEAILVMLVTIIAGVVTTVLMIKKKRMYEEKMKEAEAYVLAKKQQNDMQYKKIISLTPKELDEYLGIVFGYFLEVNTVSRVSEKDPDASVKLYANTLSSMMSYIGEENIEALDYYYGSDYLSKWCELRYALLENRRILSPIINKTYSFDNPITTQKENTAG